MRRQKGRAEAGCLHYLLALWNAFAIPLWILDLAGSAIFGDFPAMQDLLFQAALYTLTLVGMYVTRPRTPLSPSADGHGDAG